MWEAAVAAPAFKSYKINTAYMLAVIAVMRKTQVSQIRNGGAKYVWAF
jgi:hypothetical protein